VFCAVIAVFHGIAYYLFAAAFADRAADPGQLFHTARADQTPPGQDDPGAYGTTAGIQKIQKTGVQPGYRYYSGHDTSL